MEIKRIDGYCDPRFSQKVLAQHGCFTAGENTFEVEIISQEAAIVRGNAKEYYEQVMEEFRFYAPHIHIFYDQYKRKLREYPRRQLFWLPLAEIQPSQFYVDKDKVEAVKTFVQREEDIVIPVLPYQGRYISLDGHTRLFCGVEKGFHQVLAFVDESGDYIFDFAVEAVRRNITTPHCLLPLSHQEYCEKWHKYCENYFLQKKKNVQQPPRMKQSVRGGCCLAKIGRWWYNQKKKSGIKEKRSERMAVLIKSGNVLVDGGFQPAEILVEQGRIAAVAQKVEAPAGCQTVDLRDKTVLPGLIDTHIHGFAGWDTMDCTEEALAAMARALLKAGVTSFYPTTMTAGRESIEAALRCVAKTMHRPAGGARILGAFAEGPFISAEHRGAQPMESISPIDLPWLETLCSGYHGALKKMILAPELPEAAQAVRFLREKGVIAALGHSSAKYSQAKDCAQAGASIAVHTYNGMSSLHHREPGMVGAAMHLDQLYAELICDGIHVHPAAMEVLLRCKGPKKLILISDCMRAGGMEDGEYMLGDTKTIVKNGVACTESGALAGSTLRLIDGVKNAAALLGVPLEQAAAMASEVPAMSMGIFEETGSIAPGKWADLIAIDGEYQVVFSMVGGEVLLQE